MSALELAGGPGKAAGGPAREKREVIRRLREYRLAGGPGCLERAAGAVRPKGSVTAELLRDLCQGRAPRMRIDRWRRIAKALDGLEGQGKWAKS